MLDRVATSKQSPPLSRSWSPSSSLSFKLLHPKLEQLGQVSDEGRAVKHQVPRTAKGLPVFCKVIFGSTHCVVLRTCATVCACHGLVGMACRRQQLEYNSYIGVEMTLFLRNSCVASLASLSFIWKFQILIFSRNSRIEHLSPFSRIWTRNVTFRVVR